MKRDVIIACDFPSAEATYAFLDNFKEEKPFIKIGMELYYAAGPEIVRELRRRGHRIFLDLKLHDIPNTVRKAMKVLSRLDVDMVNVHAAGTIEMMRAALEGLKEGRHDGERPLIIAVTQLTSTSEEALHKQLLICESMNDTIATNARGPEFLAVTPGIRYPDAAKDDQSRITSPARAREIGSDFIVVGRPITAAADPVAAYRRCCADFIGQ